MANRSAWTAGNLNAGGLAYTAAFGAELNSLANGSTVLSSVSFDNTAGMDEFFDVSAVLAIASSTIAAGAGLTLWLAALQGDTTSYGEGRLALGASSPSYFPGFPSFGAINFQTGATITALIGDLGGLSLRPCKFALCVQNLTGFNLASSGNSIWIRTYNQNLNN